MVVGRQTFTAPKCIRPFLDSCLSLSSPRKFSLGLRCMCFNFLMKYNPCSRSQKGEEWVKEGGELLVWECIVEQRKHAHSISQDMAPRDHIISCVRKKRELIFWLLSCKSKLCPKKKDVPSAHLWSPSASFTDPHASLLTRKHQGRKWEVHVDTWGKFSWFLVEDHTDLSQMKQGSQRQNETWVVQFKL